MCVYMCLHLCMCVYVCVCVLASLLVFMCVYIHDMLCLHHDSESPVYIYIIYMLIEVS